MATSTTVTPASDEVGSGLITATGSAVDTVTFADTDLDYVEVLCPSDSPAGLWWTDKGGSITPTVGSKKCFYVPPGMADRRAVRTSGSTVVKLISSGAATYVVQDGGSN